MSRTIFGEKQDAYFMDLALEQAHRAYDNDEVPVGAVVIDSDGGILAQAYNQVERCGTQRAHAEMLALEQAARSIGNWRLGGCWLYVTLEPCTMCMGLAQLSRIAGIAYGAPSPLFGYRGGQDMQLFTKDRLIVVSGVREQQAVQLLKKFFYKKRVTDRG